MNPLYPYELARTRSPGKVTFDFYVEPDGNVQEVNVISSTDPLFSGEAVKAVRQWKFKPALTDGVPVRSHRIRSSLEFSVQ